MPLEPKKNMKPSERIQQIAKELHNKVYGTPHGTDINPSMNFWPDTLVEAIIKYLDENPNI